MSLITDEERSFILNDTTFLKGLSKELISDLIAISNVITYPKGSYISRIGELMNDVIIVISGLVRVNACSSSGKQITFLLVQPGQNYNMLSPFADTPRFLEAVTVEKTRCLSIRGADYKKFVEAHPPLACKMLTLLSGVLDGAHSRILDLMEKNVDKRIMRVLSTLHSKFGSPLQFASREIADIAGTTTESVLRTMARLRSQGIIETQRGKIWINDPDALEDKEFGKFII